jgi:putative component of membrane protein insertase Oxa1/YidC/SpoIIIJ protein YidD
MTATLSLSPLACRTIAFYQRHLSPYKGFRCAYRVRHTRRASFSQFARRAIERLGVVTGVQLLRRRLDKCRQASKTLDYEPARARETGRWKDQCWAAANSGSACDARSPVDACDVASIGCDLAPLGCDLWP